LELEEQDQEKEKQALELVQKKGELVLAAINPD
jgi:hypothetical protein